MELNLTGQLNVLFIGNYWPHARGGHRVHALARHAAANGVSMVVLTTTLTDVPEANDGVVVVESRFRGDVHRHLRRLLGRTDEVGSGLTDRIGGVRRRSWRARLTKRVFRVYLTLVEFPDADRTWKRDGLGAAREIMSSNRIDVVMSGAPFTSHRIARRIKKEFRVPWLVDLTDLWSQNHAYPYLRIRRPLDAYVERRTLLGADAVVTSSGRAPAQAAFLAGVPVTLVHHGYPDELLKIHPKRSSEPTVTYVGNLYEDQDGLEVVLGALDDLIDAGSFPASVRIRFLGTKELALRRRAQPYKCADILEIVQWVPREDAVRLIAESSVLLLFGSSNPEWAGEYTSKVYDYIGARRPVWYVGGSSDDLVIDLLHRVGLGTHLPSRESVAQHLIQLGSGRLNLFPSHDARQMAEIEGFSHGAMATRIFDIARSCGGERARSS